MSQKVKIDSNYSNFIKKHSDYDPDLYFDWIKADCGWHSDHPEISTDFWILINKDNGLFRLLCSPYGQIDASDKEDINTFKECYDRLNYEYHLKMVNKIQDALERLNYEIDMSYKKSYYKGTLIFIKDETTSFDK